MEPVIFSQADASYYTVRLAKNEVKIDHCKFSVEGEISNYPQPVELVYHDKSLNRFYTVIFFIDHTSSAYSLNLPDLKKIDRLTLPQSNSQVKYNEILDQLKLQNIDLMPFDDDNLKRKNTFLINTFRFVCRFMDDDRGLQVHWISGKIFPNDETV